MPLGLTDSTPSGDSCAHVADVGQLQRGFRIDAGGIARDQPVLLAERIDDLGDRAADRGDARRIREDLLPFLGDGSGAPSASATSSEPRANEREKARSNS